MRGPTLLRRTGILIGALPLFALSSCDALFAPDHDPNYFAMLIQTSNGGPPFAVMADGEMSPGGLTIQVGVPTVVSVEFINSVGAQVLPDGSQLFRATIKPSAGITFERLGGYHGTITGAAAGTVKVEFGLFHVEAGHHDFGLFAVPVTITP